MISRRSVLRVCLVLVLLPLASVRIALADPPIDESGNFTTVTVNAGQTITSTNATAAITLGGGSIDNAGTVENTSPGGTAILVEDGALVENQATGTITGNLVFQAQSGGGSSLVNGGLVNGTAAFNTVGTGPAFIQNAGTFNGNGDLAITISGASSDEVRLSNLSSMTGQISMGGSSLGDDDDDDDDDEDFVGIETGATLTTVTADTAIAMGSGRVDNAGTITAANTAITFADTGSDGFRRSVTNSGTIAGNNGNGISDNSSSSIRFELFNGGSITTTTGAAVGVGRSFDPFQSTASVVIDNSSSEGDRVLSGFAGVDIGGNTQVQVTNAGSIEGEVSFGLRIDSQANDFVRHSITNDGTILGEFGAGVDVFHASVDGDDDDDDDDDQGVTAELITTNSGSISGDSGLVVRGDIAAQVANSGVIGGNGFGQLLGDDDDDDDDDDGGRGIFIATEDRHDGLTHTVNNTGLIEGNTAGIQVDATGAQISSVEITNGGELLPEDIDAPTIRGGVGVLVTGDTGTSIRNFGIIAGGDDDDDDDDDGILSGVGVGVVADAFEPTSHFLANTGTITGQSAGAVFLSDEILRFDPFQGTNDAKMTVTVHNGEVRLPAALEPLALAPATIAGDDFGLLFAGNVEARVTNAGLIEGNASGVGVFADGEDTHQHSIDNSGTIRSNFDSAIEVVDQSTNSGGASSLTLTNSGIVEGRTGVSLAGNLAIDITNSGTIRTLDGDDDDDDDDDGVQFEVGSAFALNHRIVNTGTIEATGDAVSGFASTGTASTFTIDNQGTLTGARGIDLFTENYAVDITNSGTIHATAERAAAIEISQGDDDDDDDDDGQPVNIVNTGTILADAPGSAAIRYRGAADLNVTSSGVLTATDNFAVEAGGGDDTINLLSGSSTTGSILGNSGDDALNLDGAGQLAGDVFEVEAITKTGEGTFTVLGSMSNDGDPFGLSVLGGTLEITPGDNEVIRPRALAGEVTNADVFVTSGATLLVQDGAHLQVNDLDITAGGHLVIGSGGAGARVDDGTGTTETTAAFSDGASFTVNQNSELDVRDLEMTDSSGVVAGTATVSNSLTMINSAIHVTETGIFSALNDIFLENSTLTVDEGGQITGIDVIEYTGSEVTVNGTQGGSVLLGAGSTLKGKGTILGNAILLSGAKLAPGNSPDTITIGGNLVLNAGTTTEIELTQTQNDRVNVGGTATLGGTLQIIQLEPLAALRSSKTFTIIDAPNSPIQGAFAAIDGTFVRPTISLQAVQNTNTFQLVFTRNLFQTFQQSANELAVGRNLDLYMAGTSTALDPLVTALDGLTTNQQVSDSLDKLHPEVFDTLPQVGVQHAQQLASQMEQYLYTARLNLKANPAVRGTPAPATTAGKLGAIAPSVATGSMVPDAGVNGFTSAGTRYGGFGYAYSFEVDQDSQRNGLGALVRTGAESKDRGVITGVDKRVNDETVVGLTFGVGSVDSLFRDGRGSSDGDVRQVGAYATWLREDKYLDAMLAYQAYDFTTLRIVDIPGFLNRLRSSQDMDGLTAYVGGGWMRQSGDWQWGPTASLQWTQLDVDGFTETGGIAGLTVAGRDIDSLRSTLGVRASRKYEYGDTCQVVPELRLRWSHEFANDDRAVVANFAGAPLAAFTAEAARPDRDTVLAGASVNAYFKKDLSVFANYDTELGRDGANVHAGRGGVALKF